MAILFLLIYIYTAVKPSVVNGVLLMYIRRLVPTAQYYPLRFLCVRELNKLSLKTSTHIPVLPFLLEVTNFLITNFLQRCSVVLFSHKCALFSHRGNDRIIV